MDRRELVLEIMASGSVPFLAPSAGHAAARGHWPSQFEASVEPWQPAFATAAADFSLTAARVRGRFPDAVTGTLYRNGPAGHDLGGERYHHWFDGDGMVHPRVEPDGTIWNAGVSSHSGMLRLFEIAPDGVLRRADAFPVSDLPMVHDFAVTARHLVFLLPPLGDAEQVLGCGSLRLGW